MRAFLAFLLFSFAFPVFAEEKIDVYSVTMPVENISEPQRQAAFTEALHHVVDNLAANPNIKSDADLSELFAHPEYYVESYSYLSDPEQQDTLQIIVHFDPQALRPFFPQQHTLQSQRLSLQVSGMTSAETLNAVTDYLAQISAVKSVTIEQVLGENVILSVFLQGSESHFIQILLSDQRFVSLSAEDSEASALRFKWAGE